MKDHIDVAVIILYDDHRKMLLQQRTDDDHYNPGNWALFGGGIEQNESPEKAVRREAIEEIGYKLKNSELVTSHAYDIGYKEGKIYLFIEKFDLGKKITLGEGKGFAWFSPSQTKHLNLLEIDIRSINNAKAAIDLK